MRASETSKRRPRRIPLSLSAWEHSFPGPPYTTIFARPQVDGFWPERLLIEHADRWIVENVWLRGRPLLRQPIPGPVFAPDGSGASDPVLRFGDPAQAGDEIAIQVRYVGHGKTGEPFLGCLFGTEGEPRRIPCPPEAIETISARVVPGCPSPPGELTSAVLRATEEFYPEQIVIEDAADWIIHDVRVKGVSLLMLAGDLPGVMFSGGRNCPRLRMGFLAPGDEIEIFGSYTGRCPGGSPLVYQVSGPRRECDRSQDARDGLMPMASGVNILPFQSASFTNRALDRKTITPWPHTTLWPHAKRGTLQDAPAQYLPPGHGFRIGSVLLERPDDWIVNQLQIGPIAQFAQVGDIPGAAFGSGVIDGGICLTPAKPGIDISLVASYQGPNLSGDVFVCGIAGDIVPLPSP